MMRREARWLGGLLGEYGHDLGQVLSVGSGTKDFRSVAQPWIEAEVFAPLSVRGVRVLHHELFPGDGVDVAGDLGDPLVRQRLRELDVRTILCLNVLEHVADPASLASSLVAALPPAGRLIVTVPQRFPYHADPIDTLLRPTAVELAQLFRAGRVVRSGTVECESLLSHWWSKPGKLIAARKAFDRTPAAAVEVLPDDVVSADRRYPAPTRAQLLRMAVRSTAISFVVVEP